MDYPMVWPLRRPQDFRPESEPLLRCVASWDLNVTVSQYDILKVSGRESTRRRRRGSCLWVVVPARCLGVLMLGP
jgi:hypothetical protein